MKIFKTNHGKEGKTEECEYRVSSEDLILGIIIGIILGVILFSLAALSTSSQTAAVPPDADIVVTQNQSELDQVLVTKGSYYCGVVDGAWNQEEDTDRCVKLLERQEAGKGGTK